jgi:hypothetical protein
LAVHLSHLDPKLARLCLVHRKNIRSGYPARLSQRNDLFDQLAARLRIRRDNAQARRALRQDRVLPLGMALVGRANPALALDQPHIFSNAHAQIGLKAAVIHLDGRRQQLHVLRAQVRELGLDGNVRHVRGVLPITVYARDQGFKQLFVPTESAAEATLIPDVEINPVSSLAELINHLPVLAKHTAAAGCL